MSRDSVVCGRLREMIVRPAIKASVIGRGRMEAMR